MIHWNAILIAFGCFIGLCFIKPNSKAIHSDLGYLQTLCLLVIFLGLSGQL